MNNSNPFAPRFDTKSCPRCKGSGRIQSSGAKCFGCAGTGAQLTQRGKAAREFMRKRLIKLAGDIVVGDVVWFKLGDIKVQATVHAIESAGAGCLRFHGIRKKTGQAMASNLRPSGKVEIAHTTQELEAICAEVEAYQATLTKAGSITKRMSRAAWPRANRSAETPKSALSVTKWEE